MTWTLLRAEIAREFADHSATMWDAWDMHTPTRTEEDRQRTARAETKRRANVLKACGKLRDARKLESYRRAWERRRKAG